MPQESDSLRDSPEVQHWRAQRQHYQQDEGAYSRIQGTRPQTLAYGLNDSPAGLAGWIIEKFRAWSDCQGDVERAFSKDELLTNIMIYWVTQTINSSTRLYYETAHTPGKMYGHVDVPTGVAAFPHDIIVPLRSIAEQAYTIQRWSVCFNYVRLSHDRPRRRGIRLLHGIESLQFDPRIRNSAQSCFVRCSVTFRQRLPASGS